MNHKQYELTNHLGNVMATVSDKKLHNGKTNTGLVEPAPSGLGWKATNNGSFIQSFGSK